VSAATASSNERRADHVHGLALVRPLVDRRDHLVGAAAHDQRVDAGDEVAEAEVAPGAVIGCTADLRVAGEPGEVAVEAGDEPVDAHAEEDRTGEGRVHAGSVPQDADGIARPAHVSRRSVSPLE
jgi:hypothetical protein